MKLFTTSIILILFINIVSAQRSGIQTGNVTGIVSDSTTNKPVEYANVVLFSSDNNKLIDGTISDTMGAFDISGLKEGNYFIKVIFMGFETREIGNIVIGPAISSIHLGELKIKPSAIALNGVTINGDHVPFSYQIDKKVINVSQLPIAASGTAIDVLENMPSVEVDIDGNVILRGSSNFMVLIDGRPNIFSAQEILQQTPASTIQTIEIITNPSARYEPDGTAGIINIILKKNKSIGWSGLSSLNSGLNKKYGGEVIMELKNSFFTSRFGLDYNSRFYPSVEKEKRIYRSSSTEINSAGTGSWGRANYGLRGGVSFNLTAEDVWGIDLHYGGRDIQNFSVNNFSEISPTTSTYYYNKYSGKRQGHGFSIGSNYQHKFDSEENELAAFIEFGFHRGDDFDLAETMTGQNIINGNKTTEYGPGKEIEMNLDYTFSINENNKLEAGLDYESEISNEGNGLYQFNVAGRQYEFQPMYSNEMKSTEQQGASYFTYSGTLDQFGFKIGLRGEYTYRKLDLIGKNYFFKVDDWTYFPTMHLSYKFPAGYQMMAGYSRRIERPWGWALEPYLTWFDANTVREGNPLLIPAFIDSYELGFQVTSGPVSFSSEFYYRINNNLIEEVRSVYSENITLHKYENIGKDKSFGNEILINTELFKIWNINLMGNIYDYRMNGTINEKEIKRNSFNWRARLNNTVKFGLSMIQLNMQYNSPSVSSQGRREQFFTADIAFRTDLMNRQLALILQIRDLFKTGKSENITDIPEYYSYHYSEREAPVAMLTIRLTLNNFKSESGRGEDDGAGTFSE